MRPRAFQTELLLSIMLVASSASANEYSDSENIAAVSAEKTPLGLQRIEIAAEAPPSKEVLEGALEDARPFWRDSVATLRVRAFDFDCEDGNGDPVAEAFAVGTNLTLTSGEWRERLSVSMNWATSTAIDAPEDLDGTGLLGEGQSDLSVVSVAYARYDFTDTWFARLYRQEFNMPYINRQDSRMIPNTYEGYVVLESDERFDFIAGHITKIKRRDSEEFIPMGEAAGILGDESGTSVLGGRFDATPEVTLGAIVQHTSDLFTTLYSEASYRKTFSEDWGLQLAAQLTNQFSNGDELLGEFETYSWGLRSVLSFRGAILTLAHTQVGSDSAIRRPFGGTPAFTSSMIFNFDRAGEKATRVGLSQNFEPWGLPGASIVVNYTTGYDAFTAAGSPFPDAEEIAVTADYRPQAGWLRGLWFRVRWGELDLGNPLLDRRDLRVIVNYNLQALQ